MKTTLKHIKSFKPCASSWIKGLEHAKQPIDLNQVVTPMDILNAVGIVDSIWALRAFEYRDYCRFLADIAEMVYPYSNDKRVWDCIQAIHYWHAGIITDEQLNNAAAACAAVDNTAFTAAAACAAACAAADNTAFTAKVGF